MVGNQHREWALAFWRYAREKKFMRKERGRSDTNPGTGAETGGWQGRQHERLFMLRADSITFASFTPRTLRLPVNDYYGVAVSRWPIHGARRYGMQFLYRMEPI
jgi:hypothetical protein